MSPFTAGIVKLARRMAADYRLLADLHDEHGTQRVADGKDGGRLFAEACRLRDAAYDLEQKAQRWAEEDA